MLSSLYKLYRLNKHCSEMQPRKKHPKANQRTIAVVKWFAISMTATYGYLFLQQANTKLLESWNPPENISLQPECKSDVDQINDFFSDRHGGLDWDIQAHNMETCIK